MEIPFILVLLTAVCTGTDMVMDVELGVQDRVVELGAKLLINCPYDNAAGVMAWKENGVKLATGNRYKIRSASGYSTLTIGRLEACDNGTVLSCIATFHTGGYGGANIRLTVLAHGDLPRGFPRIASDKWESEVRRPSFGDVVHLPCFVTGNPMPHVAWYKDSVPIDRSDKRYSMGSSNVLFIRHVGPEDIGSYECVARNTHGRAHSKPLKLRFGSHEARYYIMIPALFLGPRTPTSHPDIRMLIVGNLVGIGIIAIFVVIESRKVRLHRKRESADARLMADNSPSGVDESDNDWDPCNHED